MQHSRRRISNQLWIVHSRMQIGIRMKKWLDRGGGPGGDGRENVKFLTILTALRVCSRIATGRAPSTAALTAVPVPVPVRGTVAACMAALRL
jgi:hypothetical protein